MAPLVVSDSPAMADVLRVALALTGRQLRELVRERGIPHETWHRHIYCRAEDVARALLGNAPDAPASSSHPVEWSEDEAVRRLARRGSR